MNAKLQQIVAYSLSERKKRDIGEEPDREEVLNEFTRSDLMRSSDKLPNFAWSLNPLWRADEHQEDSCQIHAAPTR